MSFTLDKCAVSQSASPCMPHQRGKTEYTGFSAWLKALVWICCTVLKQCERRCQSLSEVTSLKVNPKNVFVAISLSSSCLRLHPANGQRRHQKHDTIFCLLEQAEHHGICFCNFFVLYCTFVPFLLPPTFPLCCVIIASYSLAQVGR